MERLIRALWCLLACISPMLAGAQPPLTNPSSAFARTRVVAVDDAAATDAFMPQPEAVRALLHRGLTLFTGKADATLAWRSLVSTQDIVGLKVFSRTGPQVGTRPELVAAVIEDLLAARLPANHIIVWDRQLSDLRRAGFSQLSRKYGVRLAGAVDSGWDEHAFYESGLIGQLVFGDLEFQRKGDNLGRKSFVTTLLTKEITRIINISPMLNHNSAGVCGNLYSLALGSVDNTLRFEGSAARLAEAVPDIYNLPGVGDHVALNIVDALVCQYEGEEIVRLHCSVALNQLRFSKDPVALDVLSIEEIAAQRRRADLSTAGHTNRLELYQNAALLDLGSANAAKIDFDRMSVSPPRGGGSVPPPAE